MTTAASVRIAREAPAEISFAIDIALDPAIGLGLSMELAPCVAGACSPILGLVHTTTPPPMPATSPPNLTSPPQFSPPLTASSSTSPTR